jgi:hypothetical protein
VSEYPSISSCPGFNKLQLSTALKKYLVLL